MAPSDRSADPRTGLRTVRPVPPRVLNGALSDLAARIARRVGRAIGPGSTSRFLRSDVDARIAVGIQSRIDEGTGPVQTLRTVWIEASDRSFAALHVVGRAGPGCRGLRIDVLASRHSDTRVRIDLPAPLGVRIERSTLLAPVVHELVRAARRPHGPTHTPGMSPDGVIARVPQRSVDLVVDAVLRFTDAFVSAARGVAPSGGEALVADLAAHEAWIRRVWRRLEPQVGEVVVDALAPPPATLAV